MSLRNAAHIAATYKRIPDGVTEAVRYLKPVWQVIGKIVDMKLSGDGDGACMCAVLMEKEIFED